MGNEANNIGLSPKRRKFCEEYVADFNGKQAAIRAGYAPKGAEVHASKMLRFAKVQAYISELKAKIAKDNAITVQWVLDTAKNIIKVCQEPDDRGRIDASGANGSLKIIASYLDMNKTKVDMDTTVKVEHNLDTLTTEELQKLLELSKKLSGAD